MRDYLIPFNFEKFSDRHNVRDAIITTHAKEEAQRKFGKSHKLAEGWIRANLAHAKYVGDVLDDKGERETKLYAYKRIAFIVSKEGDTIITIYPRNRVSTEFSEPIRKYIEKEIRKVNRKVDELERNSSLEKAQLKIEIAELEYRLLKTT